MVDKKITFEEALGRLEGCAERISSSDICLEEALGLYEKGAEYYAVCDRILKDAKQRIEEIGSANA
jgi:exodeoxyribonuclease VII small subunit